MKLQGAEGDGGTEEEPECIDLDVGEHGGALIQVRGRLDAAPAPAPSH